MAVVSPHEAWAVGEACNDDRTKGLAEHWDGVRWTVSPIPDLAPGDSTLVAVAAVSRRDVWAVGGQIERWNGQHWQRVPDPMPATTYTALAARAPNDIWVAGTGAGNGNTAILAHWDGRCWSTIAVQGHG